MDHTRKFRWVVLRVVPPIALLSLLEKLTAKADAVIDWNVAAADLTVAAGRPGAGNRVGRRL
jgi:hypothetical protein